MSYKSQLLPSLQKDTRRFKFEIWKIKVRSFFFYRVQVPLLRFLQFILAPFSKAAWYRVCFRFLLVDLFRIQQLWQFMWMSSSSKVPECYGSRKGTIQKYFATFFSDLCRIVCKIWKTITNRHKISESTNNFFNNSKLLWESIKTI